MQKESFDTNKSFRRNSCTWVVHYACYGIKTFVCPVERKVDESACERKKLFILQEFTQSPSYPLLFFSSYCVYKIGYRLVVRIDCSVTLFLPSVLFFSFSTFIIPFFPFHSVVNPIQFTPCTFFLPLFCLFYDWVELKLNVPGVIDFALLLVLQLFL